MNKTAWGGLIALGLLVGVTIGLISTTYIMPQSGTIPSIRFDIYVDTVKWTNNTGITWGDNLNPGTTYNKNLTVVNTSLVNAQVFLILSSFPSDWIQTWIGNETIIAPQGTVKQTLTLTVPVTANPETYNWNTRIIGVQV